MKDNPKSKIDSAWIPEPGRIVTIVTRSSLSMRSTMGLVTMVTMMTMESTPK